MMNATCRLAVCAWVVTALATGANPVGGQQATAGVYLQSYSMGDATNAGFNGVLLLGLPWSVQVEPMDGLEMSLSGGWARASVAGPAGGASVLQGLLDSRFALAGRLWDFTLGLEANLPTGDPVGDIEEAAVEGVLSSDVLPFHTRRWGSGRALGAGLGYSIRVSRTRIRFVGGITSVQPFSALEDSWAGYSSGSRRHLQVGVETGIGVASVVAANLRLQRFGEDRVEDVASVVSGNRTEGDLSYARPVGNSASAVLYGALSHRAGGAVTLFDPDAPPDLYALLPATRDLASRQRLAAGIQVVLLRQRYTLRPRAEFSALRRGDGRGQGWMGTLEVGGEYRMRGGRPGRRVVLAPRSAIRFGGVTPYEGVNSTVLGWEAGLSVIRDFSR
jgi:hypothetical protein